MLPPVSSKPGVSKLFSKGHISNYTTFQVSDILRNVIVSGYDTFYQIKIFSKIYYFFIIDKMSSRDGFGPRAVVWRRLF